MAAELQAGGRRLAALSSHINIRPRLRPTQKIRDLVAQMQAAKLTFADLDVRAQTTGGARTDQFQGGSFAAGGYITGPGTGTSDSVLSKLSNGEYVMTAAAVQRIGVPALNQLNYGMPSTPSYMSPRSGYASGGPVAITPSPDSLAAELRGMRQELNAGLAQIASLTAAGPQATGREVALRVGAGGSRRSPGGAS